MTQAIVGLGSNINPQMNIAAARRLIGQKFKVLKESTFVTTKAIGPKEQPDFINGAMLLEIKINEDDLKKSLCQMEKKLGRARTEDKYAPRVIDLDLIVWDKKIVDLDFYSRNFLKSSVLELLQDLKY